MRRPEILAGVSVVAFARGNRRIIAATKARGATPPPDPCTHPEHQKPTHAEHCASHPRPVVPVDGPHPFKVWATRLGGTAAALFVLWPLVGKWVPTAVAVAATVWMLTALILGQEEPAAETTEKLAPEGSASTPEPTTPTLAEVHHLTASLASTGSSVLLTRLASELATRHPGWEPSTKAVRALLATVGIRVRDGVRTPDGNGPGVHHKDAPPIVAAPETTPVGVVVADQSANTNANNAEPAVPREGFTTQPDPDNPTRTMIIHAA